MADLRAVVDTMLGDAPGLARAQIRVDRQFKRASVIDVSCLVTGSAANASNVLFCGSTANTTARAEERNTMSAREPKTSIGILASHLQKWAHLKDTVRGGEQRKSNE